MPMADNEPRTLYTVGHSNHPIDEFVGLLKRHGITVVADVRSAPYSGYAQHFNKEPLAAYLKRHEVEYVFLGKELGARPDDSSCYKNGRVEFKKLATTFLFNQGLERLWKGVQTHSVALMCAEKDPTTCHRMILVCRNLRSMGWHIQHILADGSLEDHQAAERRLVAMTGVQPSLFDTDSSAEALVDQAYDRQAEQIAMQLPEGYELATGGQSD